LSKSLWNVSQGHCFWDWRGIEGGKELKAVQVGGPSGGLIPLSMIDMGLDFENLSKIGSIVGSGGMVVFDEEDCIVSVARFFLNSCSGNPAVNAPPAESDKAHVRTAHENH